MDRGEHIMSMIEDAAGLPRLQDSSHAVLPVPLSRHRVRVHIAASFLQALVTTGAAQHAGIARCVSGVPPDAQLVGLFLDGGMWPDPVICLVFQHPSFDPVPEGQMSPMLTPSFEVPRP